jgi:hypothetical protein
MLQLFKESCKHSVKICKDQDDGSLLNKLITKSKKRRLFTFYFVKKQVSQMIQQMKIKWTTIIYDMIILYVFHPTKLVTEKPKFQPCMQVAHQHSIWDKSHSDQNNSSADQITTAVNTCEQQHHTDTSDSQQVSVPHNDHNYIIMHNPVVIDPTTPSDSHMTTSQIIPFRTTAMYHNTACTWTS